METIIIVTALVSGIIASIGMGIGFDYRKPSSWVYIVCGFIFGFFLAGGIVIGILAALITLWGGIFIHKAKQRFKK